MALSKDSAIFLDFVKMFMQYLLDHPEIGSFDPTIITGGSSKTIAQLVTEKEAAGTASTQIATLRGGFMGTLASLVSDLQGRATTAQVDARIQQVVGAAPAALDTLVELAAALTGNQDALTTLVGTVAGKEATGVAANLVNLLRGGYAGTLAQLVTDVQGRATLTQVDSRIQQLIGAAPAALDTLAELATAFTGNQTAIGAVIASLADKVNAVPGKGLSTVDVTPDMLVDKSPDGKVDEDALPDLFLNGDQLEQVTVVGTDGVTRRILQLTASFIASLGGTGGGGTTPPAGLANSIEEIVATNQQPRLSMVNDVLTFSSPNDSIPLAITETGGTAPYTRVWTKTSPDGSGFWDNNNTSGNTVSLLGIGKNGPWSISCETTDSAGTKKTSTLNFTVVGYGGTGGGGGGTLEGTIVPRSKSSIGAPDNSIDFLISVKGGTPPYSASFSKTGASGSSGGEPFTDSGAGFPAAGYTGFRSYVHSVNVSGNYESVVTVNDNAGNSKEFRIGFTVSGY